MEMNQEQMKNMFKYFDSYKDERVKKDIFDNLGHECFKSSKSWVDSLDGNIENLLRGVNIEHRSPYWEKLEFNEDKTILYLTGREVEKCACALSEMENPPKSLCNYCCKTFQEDVFGTLFGKKVRVEITESRILNGKRCSTAIYIKE